MYDLFLLTHYHLILTDVLFITIKLNKIPNKFLKLF